MNKVYIALYKGARDGHTLWTYWAIFCDYATRKMTKGLYSHCELVINKGNQIFDCYSSSVRDKGVRMKSMKLPKSKWDLIAVNISEQKVIDYFSANKDKKYDFLGAGGIVLGVPEDRNKLFCSEFVFNCITGSDKGWRFSPNDLYPIFGD